MIESLYKPFQKWSEKGGIFVFSDPHFEDEDLVNVYDDRPSADELVRRINSKVGKCDTLICLGDVGALSYVPFLRGYKVLVMGNHDTGRTLYERKVYTARYSASEYTKNEVLNKIKILRPNCKYTIRKNPFEECLDGIPNTKPKAWIFKSFQLLVAFQKLKFCKVVSLGIFF